MKEKPNALHERVKDMLRDRPVPDISDGDADVRLKEQLLLATRIGWHCPRETRIMDRIRAFVDQRFVSYDEEFRDALMAVNDTWFYDMGYSAESGYRTPRPF